MCNTYFSSNYWIEILVLASHEFISAMKKRDSHDQNENAVTSGDNIEKYPSDEGDIEESSEEDESSMMIGLMKTKHLEIIWFCSLILTKTIAFMIQY